MRPNPAINTDAHRQGSASTVVAGYLIRSASMPELMRRIHVVLRYVWALPATAIGLVVAAMAVCTGATIQLVDGVMEVAGGEIDRAISLLPRSLQFGAITFGHVIIGVDHAFLGRVRLHERVHVQQYERWGALFFPLYFMSSLTQLVQGRDPYLNNHFELEAYARSGSSEA